MSSINLRRDAALVKEAPPQPAYTGVRIYVGRDESGDDLYYSAGDTTGSVLEIENPWAEQGMANSIASRISGYAYRPMQATDTLLDAAAEMGDAVSVNGVYSVIARRDTTFGSLLVSDIAAPSDGELGHEYQYEVKQNRQTRREINQASSQFIVQLDEIKGQVTDDQGNYTVMTLKSDGLYVGGNSTTLDGANITNGTISGTKITAGGIDTNQIAAGAITANKIATATITADQIAGSTITSAEIKAEAIRTSDMLLTGMLSIYNSTSKTYSAQLGYGRGQDGSGNATDGAKLVATGGSNYFIVTDSGARMQAGSGYIYTADNSCHCSSAFVADSDARIKEDVDDDMSAYKNALLNLRPVSFKYIPERQMGDKRYTGLIAQEAEAVMDECGLDNWSLASVNGEGIHGICYEALIPVLVSCVQDLSREIAELKERING